LKLLQLKYKLQEDAVGKQNKGPISKSVFSLFTPLLVLKKKIFKGNAFLADFGMLCTLCALDEAVVH
jgi:hypothetical protein